MRLYLLCVLAPLVVLTAATDAATGPSSCRKFQLVASKQVLIDSTVSSSLLSQSGLPSPFDCLMWCWWRGCAVVEFNKISRVCQLVVINDESAGQSGPEGSHVTRQLGSPSDANVMVWKTEDLEMLLYKLSCRSCVFRNTNTGSVGVVHAAVIYVKGCYSVEAYGAAGGSLRYALYGILLAAKGARAAGRFQLSAGTQLDIVVGQAGGNSNCLYGAGGGGGSFVYVSGAGIAGPQLLVAAGGGGGSGNEIFFGSNGNGGVNGTNSTPYNSIYSGMGGTGGQPGLVSPNGYSGGNCGGPGAGWNGSAVPCNSSDSGRPGLSRIDGWLGGSRGSGCATGDGGFGGGGGGGGCCVNGRSGASGGGGGFSGGGAASYTFYGGGGGGSFCSGFDCVTVTGANSELQGRVLLNWTAAAC